MSAAASGPVVYVRTLLDASWIELVGSGDEHDGNSSVSLLAKACLLTASSRSVLLVMDGEPNDVLE